MSFALHVAKEQRYLVAYIAEALDNSDEDVADIVVDLYMIATKSLIYNAPNERRAEVVEQIREAVSRWGEECCDA